MVVASLCFIAAAAWKPRPGWMQPAVICCTLGAAIVLPPLGAAATRAGYTFYRTSRDYGRENLPRRISDRAEHDLTSYPAGWMAELPFAADWPRESFRAVRYLPHAEWHSWLTGLFRVERQPVEAWFPGGTLSARDGIVYRPRREGPAP